MTSIMIMVDLVAMVLMGTSVTRGSLNRIYSSRAVVIKLACTFNVVVTGVERGMGCSSRWLNIVPYST
jgi:hypothetical protein